MCFFQITIIHLGVSSFLMGDYVNCNSFINMGKPPNSISSDYLRGFYVLHYLYPSILTSQGAFELIIDESKAGSCLWITNRRGFEYWPTPSEEEKYLIPSSRFRRRSEFKAPPIKLPDNFEKMCVF